MFKLVQITPFSNISYLKEILNLLVISNDFISFNDYENPTELFWHDLYSKDNVIIAGIKDNSVFGVLVLKNFEKISFDKFICYLFGAAKRGFAKELEMAFDYIFSDLKKQGCVAIRVETLCSNRAMQNLAFRLHLKKVGRIEASGFRKNKLLASYLYEKLL